MANQPHELQVLIPYKDLLDLLEASRRCQDLGKQVKNLEDQIGAIRSQFTDLLILFRELQ